MASPQQIHYLNTDLDLVAPVSLSSLASALNAMHVFPLHVTQAEDGLWYATFETEQSYDEPEPNITELLDAIESLGSEDRAVWDQCEKKEFNVGYDCGVEPWAFNHGLTNRVLHRMAIAGASFRVTLYPPNRNTSASQQ